MEIETVYPQSFEGGDGKLRKVVFFSNKGVFPVSRKIRFGENLVKNSTTPRRTINFSSFLLHGSRFAGYNPCDTGARRLIKRHILCCTMRNYQIGLQQPTKTRSHLTEINTSGNVDNLMDPSCVYSTHTSVCLSFSYCG